MAATTTPISTYQTYLMYKATSAATQYTKLVDIKNFPDLGGEPERIDITTLSDNVRHYVPGVQDLSSFTFNCNYTPAAFNTINGLREVQHEYSIWVGAVTSNNTVTPDGHNGKWDFTADIVVYKAGGDVNAAQDMTVVLFPSTDFKFTCEGVTS